MATRKSKAAPAATEAAAPAASTTTAQADSEQGASLLQTGADHAGEVGAGQAGADSPEAAQDQGAPAEGDAGSRVGDGAADQVAPAPARFVDGVAAIAMVAHEVNRAYCESIGDNSQVAWANAPVDIQQSAIAGVEYKLANLDATPEQQHNAWCSHKIQAGWAYGATKDPVARTHPCLVPYSALPLEQRIKDHLFGAVVRSMSGVALTNAPVSEAPRT